MTEEQRRGWRMRTDLEEAVEDPDQRCKVDMFTDRQGKFLDIREEFTSQDQICTRMAPWRDENQMPVVKMSFVCICMIRTRSVRG